jgi:3-deoxy-D-manno-octulosonate 8-phosphate phosphatase (KDO 8-P phosphatase)
MTQEPNLNNIKLLVMDVDGVLTQGDVIIHHDGSESKSFNVLDGHGIRMWHRAGLKTAIMSGRTAEATRHRAEQLEITYVYQGCTEKVPVLERLLKESGLSAEQLAYIGDDVLDLPVMKRVGFAAAVSNAVDELKQQAHYVTKLSGGRGAVRETIEYILKKTGQWPNLVERYLA